MKEAAFLTIHKSSKINGQSRFYHLKKTTTTKTNKQANKQTNTKKHSNNKITRTNNFVVPKMYKV